MKKLILLALLAFAAWQGYRHFAGTKPAAAESASMPMAAVAPQPAAKQRFRCDGRQYCTQMTSRAEAQFFTRNCPDTKMDGDHDGVPCENDSRF